MLGAVLYPVPWFLKTRFQFIVMCHGMRAESWSVVHGTSKSSKVTYSSLHHHGLWPWCYISSLSSSSFPSSLRNCQSSAQSSVFCFSGVCGVLYHPLQHFPSTHRGVGSLYWTLVPHLTKFTLPGRVHPCLSLLLRPPFPIGSRSAAIFFMRSYTM